MDARIIRRKIPNKDHSIHCTWPTYMLGLLTFYTAFFHGILRVIPVQGQTLHKNIP